MYLSKLNLEKKKLFLDLSIHAALANNDFAEEQKVMVDAYCDEMGIQQSTYEATKELDVVLNELKEKCSNEELNIVLIETAALIMSDNIYDAMEQKFMKKLQITLTVKKKLEKILLAIDHLKISYNMLNEIINE